MILENMGFKSGEKVMFQCSNQEKARVATVVREYPFHILLNLGKYMKSANKAALYCGDEKLERIN